MYDVIDNGFLKRYAELIEQLINDYPTCWGLIHQADVRTRLEHAPRVKADCEEKHAEALVKSWPTTFDPLRPWNEVWKRLATAERTWWEDMVIRPGNQVMSGNANPNKFVDGDVLTATTPTNPSGGGLKRPRAILDTQPEYEEVHAPPAWRPTKPGKGAGKPVKSYLSVHDGTCYTKTRAGLTPCASYQVGTCGRVDAYGRCAVDHASAHQCNVCLMVGHGAAEKSKCPMQNGKGAGKPPTKTKGGGKGKGKWARRSW